MKPEKKYPYSKKIKNDIEVKFTDEENVDLDQPLIKALIKAMMEEYKIKDQKKILKDSKKKGEYDDPIPEVSEENLKNEEENLKNEEEIIKKYLEQKNHDNKIKVGTQKQQRISKDTQEFLTQLKRQNQKNHDNKIKVGTQKQQQPQKQQPTLKNTENFIQKNKGNLLSYNIIDTTKYPKQSKEKKVTRTFKEQQEFVNRLSRSKFPRKNNLDMSPDEYKPHFTKKEKSDFYDLLNNFNNYPQ